MSCVHCKIEVNLILRGSVALALAMSNICFAADESDEVVSANVPIGVITTQPETAGHSRVIYQPTPLSIYDQLGIFGGNLAVGLGDRFEIGTVPLTYAIENFVSAEDFWSLNIFSKWLAWQSERWSIAPAILYLYQSMTLAYEVDSAPTQERFRAENFDLALLIAWKLHGDRATVNLAKTALYTLNGKPLVAWQSFMDVEGEYFQRISERWTLQYMFSRRQVVLGGTYEGGIEEALRAKYGAGFGLSYERPGAFFSRPTLGAIYYPTVNYFNWGFSTTFY